MSSLQYLAKCCILESSFVVSRRLVMIVSILSVIISFTEVLNILILLFKLMFLVSSNYIA